MDFWFLIKSSFSVYVHPLTIAMELIVIGIVLVGFSRRRKKKKPGKFGRWLKRASGDFGIAAIISGVFFLFLVSIKPIADPLVFTLEKQYPPLQLDKLTDRDIASIAPEFIVVLAGGERFDPEKPPTSQLSYAAQARVNEGARLALIFPESLIVFTGQPQEVRAMTESIIALGVSRDRILSESESRETRDHPKFLRPLINDSRFLLVTSGTHMPRSMAVFEAAGYEPIAASCDLWVWPRFAEENPYTPENFIPKIEHLWMTNTVFHEYLGMAWTKLVEANEGALPIAADSESRPIPSREVTAPLPLPGQESAKPEAGPKPQETKLPAEGNESPGRPVFPETTVPEKGQPQPPTLRPAEGDRSRAVFL